MAQISKERISRANERRAEYQHMREALLQIAYASDTSNADKVAAFSLVFKIDSEGVPLPNYWER